MYYNQNTSYNQNMPGFIQLFTLPGICTIILVCLLLSIYDGIKPVKPIKPLQTYESVHVLDNASIFSYKDEVEPSLKSFQEATGICPYIITVFDSDWENKYSSLDDYASKLYKQTFTDQQHFLIVCSIYKDNPAPFYTYSTVNGTDAEKILKGDLMNEFNSEFSQYIYHDHIKIDDSFIKSFNNLVYCTGPFMYINFVEVYFALILMLTTIILYIKAIKVYVYIRKIKMSSQEDAQIMIDVMK